MIGGDANAVLVIATAIDEMKVHIDEHMAVAAAAAASRMAAARVKTRPGAV